MTPEAPLNIVQGQDEKSKNTLSPDMIQGGKSLEEMLAPYIEQKAKEMVADIFDENEKLKNENCKLSESCKELVNEHCELRKENRDMKNEIRNLRDSITNTIPYFNHYIDTRKFKGADRDWLVRLWDNIFSLCEIMEDDHYLIGAQAHVVPIYILTKEWSGFPYKFIGTYDDFCYAWNENVTVRLPLQERRQLLTLKEDSFRSAVNDKKGIGNSDVSEWGRRAKEGENVGMYERAVKIKEKMKSWGM